jgi:ABC-type nickel/cobalt efflux system permease component RcnA
MKRLIVITCSLLVLFAGAASAWANCKQISFVPDNHRRSPVPVHAHDHHSEANRQHSHDGEIHCPPLDDYLPTATFSVNKDHRIERVIATLVAGFNSQFTQHASYRLIHGPPGFAHSRILPPYLLFSVLRI